MTTSSEAAFYSARLFFHPPDPLDHAALIEAVRALREPWLGWDEAYLAREVFACDPARGRHAWVLKLVSEVVGAVVAHSVDAGLAVNVLIVPRRQGVHFGGEVIGRLAERAFGFDGAGHSDRSLLAPSIHTTLSFVNHRALRVAQRLGCVITSELEVSALPLGGRTDLVRATLTPGSWARLERSPAWDESRIFRLIDTLSPGAAERVGKRLAQRAAQKIAPVAKPRAPVAPTSTGDAVLDALLANPPRGVASESDLSAALAETPWGGHLEALQKLFAKAWFSDDQLGRICGDLRSGVSAAGELHNAERAIEWIGRYIRLRPPR
ncbi:MAG: hypothetical protein J0L92_12105 [Deltaproteobacteria bacterium]|nr:hypothetical protein [Deltaproteobacteria bacterium]